MPGLPTELLFGVSLFAAADIDDLFVLIGFFADGRFARKDIVMGQFLGIGTLVLVSAVAAQIAVVFPEPYVGLLGLAPIAIGVMRLVEGWRQSPDRDDTPHTSPGLSRYGSILTVATVAISNGGDNIAVYTSMFALRSPAEIGVIVVVFAALTATWCAVASWLVSRPKMGAPIRHYGQRVLPIILILVGASVLYEAGTINLIL